MCVRKCSDNRREPSNIQKLVENLRGSKNRYQREKEPYTFQPFFLRSVGIRVHKTSPFGLEVLVDPLRSSFLFRVFTFILSDAFSHSSIYSTENESYLILLQKEIYLSTSHEQNTPFFSMFIFSHISQ